MSGAPDVGRTAPRGPQRVRGAVAAIVTAVTSAAPPASGCESRDLAFGRAESGWAPQPLSRLKRDTVYTVVHEHGRALLSASADRSAPGRACAATSSRTAAPRSAPTRAACSPWA